MRKLSLVVRLSLPSTAVLEPLQVLLANVFIYLLRHCSQICPERLTGGAPAAVLISLTKSSEYGCL